MFRRSAIPILLVATLVSGAATRAAGAQDLTATGPAIYRLDTTSAFMKGCFGPCMCPVFAEPIIGTFTMTPAGFDGLSWVFRLSDVNWAAAPGHPELRVTGSGVYRVGGDPLQQRLELDLAVGDNPAEHFDSGLVPVGDPLPRLSISVSLSGMACYDTVFELSAAPVPQEQIVPYHLRPGSTFQQGCFEPCDCPLSEKLPIRGSFGLVELQRGPLFTEYAVVRVRWRAIASAGASRRRIAVRGFGMYRVGGEFAAQHQLSLQLRVDREDPALFDSGLVIGGAGFPRIDVPVSMHGGVCYDTVIDVHAQPRRPPAVRPSPGQLEPVGVVP